MRPDLLAVLTAGSLLLTACAPQATAAHARPSLPGSLVDVRLFVDGSPAPLYAAPDGSGRHYLEARKGARYEVRVANRTGQRIGVLMAVDGLNVVSGEREQVPTPAGARPGRMYVLAPWEDVTVRGWRSSLDEVRQFRFVDEQRSYAVRTDQANGKLGWIEVSAFRELHAPVYRPWLSDEPARERDGRGPSASKAAPAAPPATAQARPQEQADREALGSLGYTDEGAAGSGRRAEAYPGTVWGERRHDPVVTVQFEPERWPAETLTLRYEYRPALVRLGLLPACCRPEPDRLAERESGRDGFARPPRW